MYTGAIFAIIVILLITETSALFGGDGGGEFDDYSASTAGRITAVKIRSGKWIDS